MIEKGVDLANLYLLFFGIYYLYILNNKDGLYPWIASIYFISVAFTFWT